MADQPEDLIMAVSVRNRVLFAGALVTTVALIAACGNNDGNPEASDAKPVTETVVDRAALRGATPDQVLRYTAKEYAFEGPKTATAGLTQLVLTNTGLEDHQLALF